MSDNPVNNEEEVPQDPIKNEPTNVDLTGATGTQSKQFNQLPPFAQYGGMGQQDVPNSTLILVLGILAIPGCCCYGIGLVFGIIALVLANSSIKQFNLNPSAYSISSLKNIKAGKVCGIIGLILNILYIVDRLSGHGCRVRLGGTTRSGIDERDVEGRKDYNNRP